MSDAPRDEDDDDTDFDLGISLETVATVVDHIRAIQGEDTNERDTEYEDEDEVSEEDFDQDTLATFIEELNEDEQAALVALAWVGRGDYEAEEWGEAVRLAKERSAGGDTASYLLSMDMAGDLLAEGLGVFGFSIEDVER